MTRALPLLLLFVTFLFINAEVWEVAAGLDGAVMWLTVALFTAITVGFLLVRLPEELQVFDDAVDEDQVLAGCRGTPLAGWAEAHRGDGEAQRALEQETLAGLQKANLVLDAADRPDRAGAAAGAGGVRVLRGLRAADHGARDDQGLDRGGPAPRRCPFFERANMELLQVSTFLAAFSGLYFTVYAVTDEVYRKQFFTSIVRELERAVSVRVAYRALRAGESTGGCALSDP